MQTACRRWVNLASAGSRRHATSEPRSYLHFISTGLLVGLPDEPGILFDPSDSHPHLFLRETDANGLGLEPEDFTAGVAFCVDDDRATPGWSCTQLDVEIGEASEMHAS